MSRIFADGGKDGARLQAAIQSGDPATIILNNYGVDAAPLNGRVMTVDLSSQMHFYDYGAKTVSIASVTRILAHELGHAVLGISDRSLPIVIDPFGNRPRAVRSSPIVRFTDEIMSGIDGSIRRDYDNGCIDNCIVARGNR